MQAPKILRYLFALQLLVGVFLQVFAPGKDAASAADRIPLMGSGGSACPGWSGTAYVAVGSIQYQ